MNSKLTKVDLKKWAEGQGECDISFFVEEVNEEYRGILFIDGERLFQSQLYANRDQACFSVGIAVGMIGTTISQGRVNVGPD